VIWKICRDKCYLRFQPASNSYDLFCMLDGPDKVYVGFSAEQGYKAFTN
jgi:hypothetical protein